MKDTNIIYQTGVHWISNVIPITMIIIGLFFFLGEIVMIFTGDKNGSNTFSLTFWLFLSFPLTLILYGTYKYFLNKSLKIKLFNDRISLSHGVVKNEISDINLNKYEGLKINISILGRILKYGNLTISTGGVTQSYKINNPLQLRENLNDLLNLNN